MELQGCATTGSAEESWFGFVFLNGWAVSALGHLLMVHAPQHEPTHLCAGFSSAKHIECDHRAKGGAQRDKPRGLGDMDFGTCHRTSEAC